MSAVVYQKYAGPDAEIARDTAQTTPALDSRPHPYDLIEITDPREIAALGVPGLAGWINGGCVEGCWVAYRYSLEAWRAKRADSSVADAHTGAP